MTNDRRIRTLSGEPIDVTRQNAIPGVAPDTIWMAIPDMAPEMPGHSLIALVGIAQPIMKCAKRIAKAGWQVPVAMAVGTNPRDATFARAIAIMWPQQHAADVDFAVLLAGLWPEARGQGIATQLSGPGRGWRHWADAWCRLRRDPQRRDPGAPSAELAKDLCFIFLQEAYRAATRPTGALS